MIDILLKEIFLTRFYLIIFFDVYKAHPELHLKKKNCLENKTFWYLERPITI